MRRALPVLVFAGALSALAQIVAPGVGSTTDAQQQPIEIHGIAGAWVAQRTAPEPVDAQASSTLERATVRNGVLSLVDRVSGDTHSYDVGTGRARLAFDAEGRLAAALFVESGELYTRASGWRSVYTNAGVLDVAAATPGWVTVLYRDRLGLHRQTVNLATGETRGNVRLFAPQGALALNEKGDVVSSAESGVAGITSMQRVERGYYALSSSNAQWLWRPGEAAQPIAKAAADAPIVQLWVGDGSSTVDVGPTIDFPDTAPGQSSTRLFIVANTSTTSEVDITQFRTTSIDAFNFGAYFYLPRHLAAGEISAVAFKFTPPSSGPFSTTLTLRYNVTGSSTTIERTFTLTGTGTASPATPTPVVTLDNTAPGSNANVKLSVKLSSKATSAMSGSVKLAFTPTANNVTDDPTATLVSASGSSRAQLFTVAAGSDVAMFGTQDSITLATGTTQGSYVVTATAGAQTDQRMFTVSAAAPALTSVKAVRTTSTVVVTAQGYDNTRRLGSVVMAFYTTSDASGDPIPPGDLTVDVASQVTTYYAANPLIGGVFQMTATCPVTGDISQVRSVKFRVANAVDKASATAAVTTQ